MVRNHIGVRLEPINTDVAAKNFSELLDNKITYFLNGSWGSGKTTFLENVKKQSDKKLIFLDLWRLQENRTVMEFAASRLRWFWYWLFKLSLVAVVVISILMTDVVNLGLTNLFWVTVPVLKWGGLTVLAVSTYQFFKVKSDAFYTCLLTAFCFHKKVLVIDDFDRLSANQQEEAYKLFNLLKGKLPIVFVGDLTNIHQVKDNFLSKIIDRRVELPFDLHPSKIWDSYFQQLEAAFGEELDYRFKTHVPMELRNLRDREHFNDYVNRVFFKQGKLGHVQTNQQLLVIYAYLFYPEIYRKLVNSDKINKPQEMGTDDNFTEYFISGPPFTEQFYQLQTEKNNEYPPCFAINRETYFIYEAPMNRTSRELEMIFAHHDKLSEELILSTRNSDFYQYLSANYRGLSTERKEQLFDLLVKLSLNGVVSPSLDYIMSESIRHNSYSLDNPDDYLEFFESYGLDISQGLYLLEKHHVKSFHELGLLFSNLSIEMDTFSQLKRKDFYLLTYLSSKNSWSTFSDWDDSIWDCIDLLTDHEFISFWTFQNIIYNFGNYDNTDFRPDDSCYIIWEKTHTLYGELIDNSIVIEKIKSRLFEMEQRGYQFKFKTDERHKRVDY